MNLRSFLPPLSKFVLDQARAQARSQAQHEDAESKPRPLAGRTYFTGLDLGQQRDPTALVVAERAEVEVPVAPESEALTKVRAAAAANGQPLPAPKSTRLKKYGIRQIHRYELGTAYGQIVENVTKAFDAPPLRNSVLCIDGTGVGRAVVEMFTRAKEKIKARIVPITIHGGATASTLKGWWSVPKRDLAAVLQVLLGTKRLTTAPEFPLAKVLTRELETFKVKINLATGNEAYEAWRSADTDDVVLAAAICLWYAEVLGAGMGRAIIC